MHHFSILNIEPGRNCFSCSVERCGKTTLLEAWLVSMSRKRENFFLRYEDVTRLAPHQTQHRDDF